MNLHAAELTDMQTDYAATFNDSCQVGTYGGTVTGPTGELLPFYGLGAEIECGFDPTGFADARRVLPAATETETTATLRLPYGTIIGTRDHVTITKRFGVALVAPQTFALAAPPEVGPAGVFCKLKVVTL